MPPIPSSPRFSLTHSLLRSIPASFSNLDILTFESCRLAGSGLLRPWSTDG